ncbi:MFS transporter [Pseudomonas typographi]|uniref:Multidrug effflux MFS transporter n=1 Tax=Pseudomonas typographi TaxID=2715964 RepID=A0ABR7Z3R2_9PSED|nr:MFS transporter [Pseudomonas typographi]MBD1600124.1 multidrug effflux MFS transporter [Pseudomonas typographi]
MKATAGYVTYVVVMAPLLNSVSGIAIDLFAPSMPAIAREFGASTAQLQGSITLTLLAYAAGQLFFGLLADGKGRRVALLPGLLVFVLGSLLAMLAHGLALFLAGRMLQGFAVGACQVCARALLVDTVQGERFASAVVYLSLAWGLGPVLAPFIGGLVDQALGWRWNFALYAAYGATLLLLSLGLRESLAPAQRKSLGDSLRGYRLILGNARFLSATLVLGTSLSLFLVWNVIGPFVIEHALGRGAAFFGITALAAGSAYLAGTLLNRVLLARAGAPRLIGTGLACTAAGTLAMLALPRSLHVPTLLAGVLLVNFGQGLLFANVVAINMRLYPDRAGATASLLGCAMMLCAGVSTEVTGQLPLVANWVIAALFAALALLQGLGVRFVLRPALSHEVNDHDRTAVARRP